MEMNLVYRGPAASGIYKQRGGARADVAFKRPFLKKQFEAAVNFTDVFKGWRNVSKATIGNNTSDYDQYFRQHALTFSLTYKFTKGLKVEERKKAKVEEEERL